MLLQELSDVRFSVVVMLLFDRFRQSLQKQLCVMFDENHVIGIGQTLADRKNRLCRTL